MRLRGVGLPEQPDSISIYVTPAGWDRASAGDKIALRQGQYAPELAGGSPGTCMPKWSGLEKVPGAPLPPTVVLGEQLALHRCRRGCPTLPWTPPPPPPLPLTRDPLHSKST